MCGLPLPHRPLTTPGASGTLGLTRVPVENATASPEPYSATGRPEAASEMPGSADSQVAETPSSEGNGSGQAADVLSNASEEALASGQAVNSSDEPPPKELVPDLPLDEYVKSFHYEPPSDPTEITMRGDAPVHAVQVPCSEATTAEVSTVAAEAASLTATDAAAKSPVAGATATSQVEEGGIIAASSAAELKAASEKTIAAEADVDSRLGLEPESPAEARSERPRFLDINEPPAETRPASGTSTVVGPSFLGLSEAAQADQKTAALESEVAQPAQGRWRPWLAAAVVLVFAGLGAMEWRARANQTGNGPVEIIKAKINDWKQQNTSQASSEPAAAASSSDANAKSDMQVQDQPKPPAQDQATAASGAAGSAANSTSAAAPPQGGAAAPALTASAKTPVGSPVPAGQKPATPAKQTPAPSETQAAGGGKSAVDQTTAGTTKPASQETSQSAAEKAKPTSSATADNQDAANQAVPGADEMAKAKNASDSAAAAAWLWKATAKGNPDAPVQLAEMYVKGDGVPRSCEQAVVLLKTSAEKENARARNKLAAMYETGNCVPRNRVEAYRWVSSALAANPNSQWAQQNKDLLWQQMTAEERTAAGKYR
jgi:hypothetical protein